MEFKDLLQFIGEERQSLRERFPIPDPEKEVLAHLAKAYEEMGELSEDILSYCSLQRQDKLDAYSKESLGAEVSDALITILLIADIMEVDVEKALEWKIEKVKSRRN
ncbi:TPA: hypothetical protein DDW69_03475 [candidate division CPR2 bacterium]|uniref:NTP pyrophosphohydrolase MazG-like domain-containing protein n=1 Tax=candidate division CPR2 bacterium GW2011_GWC1_41_48 TaxID=1618344 RepID=A0A0G0YHK9_UNCC2|nr:MAG: hypothetical protein UT47_C0003G0112 [candidate division CPR2 bacterium GW2011_GWC2_39_35]KKS09051.1 MAG: hypothetical protein UU65_C0003G0106 [candidate division CPR2 bacterium GW2011_GWC1_41_48]HBG81875.1 hypothetical protein [candidate division CPR2 bacterium]HCL99953.1 hypothetical protein [candidate division CPR2 bacterium]